MIWHNYKEGGYDFLISSNKYYRFSEWYSGLRECSDSQTHNSFDRLYKGVADYWTPIGPTSLHRWIE